MNEPLQQYILEHRRNTPDGVLDPDPDAEGIMAAEDHLADAMADVPRVSLTDDDRTELRGKRLADLPDLLVETAAALRECDDVTKALQTDPADFERIATLDLSAGASLVSLEGIYEGAQHGLAVTCDRGETAMDDIDEKTAEVVQSADTPAPRRRVVEAHATNAAGRRKRAMDRAKATGQEVTKAAEPDQQEADTAKEASDLEQIFIQFVQAALAAQPPRPPKATAKGKSKTAGAVPATTGTQAPSQLKGT